MSNKKAKKQEKKEKKTKKLLAESFRLGWDDYEAFVNELSFCERQYEKRKLSTTEIAQELGNYETFKKILALVLLDKDYCKYVPLEVLSKSCFLSLLKQIDYETFRYLVLVNFLERRVNRTEKERIG